MTRAVLRLRRVGVSLAFSLIAVACADKAPPPPVVTGPPPDSFKVAFETTRGRFVVEAYRGWAPKGADRIHELVAAAALDDRSFFRVLPNYIVQFGAVGDPKVNAHWDSLSLADDRPFKRNLRGTVTFAANGPNTRTHQLFINLVDNVHLDSQGFVPVGQVTEGMSVVDSIYSEYRERPEYHLIATLGNKYLYRMFPKLDYIKTARIVR